MPIAALAFPRTQHLSDQQPQMGVEFTLQACRHVLVLAVPSGAGVWRCSASSIDHARSLSAADVEERNVLVFWCSGGLAGFRIPLLTVIA